MKVCFISHSSARGGAESSLVELIDALLGRGVRVVGVMPRRGPLTDLLARRDVETIVTPFKQWVHTGKRLPERVRRSVPLRHAPSVLRLARVIERSRCDVVYTNTVTVGAGAVAAKFAGRPHIWHIREFGFDDHGLSFDWGRNFSRKLIGRLSTVCIANSESVADEYRPFLAGTDLSVVYNSVEMPSDAENTPGDAPWRMDGAIRCALVGKWLPGKGHEEAVRAMAHLRRANVPAELMLLGAELHAGYRRQVAQVVEQEHLGDRVHVLGHTLDPMPLMGTADVVLMCSRREAFGRVTVEGMKLGKPIIGTRSGGTPEIVRDGETGLLYTPGDDEELAARIGHLYRHRGVRQSMGAEARRQALGRFNRENYGRDVENVLQRVAALARL